MKIREKNVESKKDLAFLKHMHGITKAFVFSYFSNWSIVLNKKSANLK